MRKDISSRSTFFYKIILPVSFLMGAAVLPAAIYLDDARRFAAVLPKSVYSGGSSRMAAAVLVFLFFFGMSGVFFMMTNKLKKLSLDGDILYASNYLKEIVIPSDNIDKVEWVGDMWDGTLRLKVPSPFGKKINFTPNTRAAADGSNPVVEELRELAKRKSGSTT